MLTITLRDDNGTVIETITDDFLPAQAKVLEAVEAMIADGLGLTIDVAHADRSWCGQCEDDTVDNPTSRGTACAVCGVNRD